MQRFPAAPWPTALKVISALGTIVLAGAAYVAYRAIPTPTGFTHGFGLGIALLMPAIVAVSLLFVVRGYAVEGGDLCVERLFWSTRISLQGLSRAWPEPAACKGSLRIFGNGGLFAFTGLYQSKALGRYRLFATDLSRSVVLSLPRRVVVVTPAVPQALLEHLRLLFPQAHMGR